MGLLSFLFGSREKFGPVYSMISVEPEFRRIAEQAIAENRYTVESQNGPVNFALRLDTDPPLRAMIKRDYSLGEPPAIIISSVQEI